MAGRGILRPGAKEEVRLADLAEERRRLGRHPRPLRELGRRTGPEKLRTEDACLPDHLGGEVREGNGGELDRRRGRDGRGVRDEVVFDVLGGDGALVGLVDDDGGCRLNLGGLVAAVGARAVGRTVEGRVVDVP